MSGDRTPSWASKAKRLRQNGVTLAQIKARLRLNRSLSTIVYWTDDKARERWRAHNRANWQRYYVHRKRRLRPRA